MDIAKNLSMGLELTVFGLGGVFLVLILFYLLTKLMMKVFNSLESRKERKLADKTE